MMAVDSGTNLTAGQNQNSQPAPLACSGITWTHGWRKQPLPSSSSLSLSLSLSLTTGRGVGEGGRESLARLLALRRRCDDDLPGIGGLRVSCWCSAIVARGQQERGQEGPPRKSSSARVARAEEHC